MKYSDYLDFSMEKKAADPGTAMAVTTALSLAPAVLNATREGASNISTMLLAAAAMAGTAGGFVTGHLSAKGQQDKKTLQKEYESARLSADLNYLSAKTRNEYEEKQRKQAPQAARVIA